MEWIELIPDNRTSLREMFANYPYLHGCVASIVGGSMGTAFVDNPDEPQIGLLQCKDFSIFAGKPIHAYVEEKLEHLIVVPNDEWETLLKQIKGGNTHAK